MTHSTPSLEVSLNPPPALATPRTLERRTFGPRVADLSAAMGKPLMDWQRTAVDVALEVDDDGQFCYKLVVITTPRQSGKTTLFGSVLDHRALTIPRARCWFTQQSGKHAVDWLINEHWPLLAPFVPKVHLRRAAGSEHIKWLPSGGLIRPFPPTPDGLHGKTSDLVVVDEPWAFDIVRGQQLDQAIVPTQATRPNAQVWKFSTAGDASSTWWLGTVEAGRAAATAGRTSGVCYLEWACPDHLDPTDPASWPVYHPAYGITIGPEAMQAALDQLGPDEFARAYGNRWVSTVVRVIPLAAWRAAVEDPAPIPAGAGAIAIGFDVAVDRSDAAIVAGWRDAGAVAHVEVVDQRPGVGWLAERVLEVAERWQPRVVAYDAAGPALDVADELGRAGLELAPVKAREYAAACAGFLEALIATPAKVRYRTHPALEAAASSAGRRALGDAWAWGRRQSVGSLAALTAATVTVWGYDHAEAQEPFRVW